MSIKDYRTDQEGCTRCNACKWIPFFQVKRGETQYVCPSISKYGFHAYSGGGKLNIGLSLTEGRTEIDATVAEVVNRCNLCGACDYSCKVYRKDLDICENIEEIRAACVEAGIRNPAHAAMVASIKQNGNALGCPRAGRQDWTKAVQVKTLKKQESGEVYFHVGCKTAFDPLLQKRIQETANILVNAGVDLITAGAEEQCCGGRIFQTGYLEDGKSAAKKLVTAVEKSGAKTLVTSCSHCYSAFKYYYPRHGIELDVEVLHTTEYLKRLIENDKLILKKSIPMNVTYHDPCNLGRRSEPFVGIYKGNKVFRPLKLTRTGELGVYDPPRKLLEAIPGMTLMEMDRIRGYSWCCGSGGGVPEAYPELTAYSGRERVKEADLTGAEALVTACPWCEESLKGGCEAEGNDMKVLDVIELVIKSAGGDIK